MVKPDNAQVSVEFVLICEALAALMAARVLAGWVGAVRWAPEGDPDLVAAMNVAHPRVPSRTACAVVDLSASPERVRRAFNRCDQQTVFEIGSVTKALTGLLLADAIERGELRADTTLGQTWPELADGTAAQATVNDLAHHRSGLPRSPLGISAPLRLILSICLGLDPYRRLGLSAVLRIAALLVQRITCPLGMRATSAEPAVHRRSGRGWLGTWAQPWRLDGYAPAGAITSTLDDLIELCRRLLDGTCPGAGALEHGLFWQVHTTAGGIGGCGTTEKPAATPPISPCIPKVTRP